MALTNSAPSGLLGAQEPRYRTVPPAVSSAGEEACDIVESCGQVLDPWQRLVLDDALGEKPDGSWAARRVGLIVPRQNGKGAILEAKALHSLFLTDQKLILWSAHLFPTAREGFLRLRGLIEANSELKKRVRTIYDANGRESVWLKDGSRLLFIARSKGGGRGFSPDEVIFDEAMILEDVAVSALSPSMSARPNPQRWYAASAPMEDSHVLRRICRQGRSGDLTLSYAEWQSDPMSDPDDWHAIADANPGYGYRLTAAAVIDDQGDMSPEDFDRERRGLWYEDDEDVILPGFRGLEDPESTTVGPVCLSIDVAPLGKWASIGAAGRRADRHLHAEITGDGDVLDHRPGMAWVVPRVVEIVANNQVCAVVLDPAGPAGALLPALMEAGVKTKCQCHGEQEVVKLTAREMAQAYGLVYDAVVEKTFHHLGQDPVYTALRGATRRELADALALDRKNSNVIISPLVALTEAAYGFSVHGPDDNYDLLDSIAF